MGGAHDVEARVVGRKDSDRIHVVGLEHGFERAVAAALAHAKLRDRIDEALAISALRL